MLCAFTSLFFPLVSVLEQVYLTKPPVTGIHLTPQIYPFSIFLSSILPAQVKWQSDMCSINMENETGAGEVDCAHL